MNAHELQALSYDPEIFEHCGLLRVHAIFPHAWHLRTEDGYIVSVVVSRWNGPLTIRVSALPRVSTGIAATLRRTSLEIGKMVIRFERARLWVASTEQSAVLDLSVMRDDLERLHHQVSVAARGGLAGAVEDLWGNGNRCEGAFSMLPTRGDTTDAWLIRGRKEIGSLGKALAHRDRDAVGQHAVGLLGLGPGLTPAGDDVLCGLLAGLSVLGRRSSHQGHQCMLTLAVLTNRILTEAPRRTTSLSSTLLQSAADGVVTEPLLHVLESAGSRTRMKGTDEVLMIGHSSGSDMLTGALLAGAMLVRWEELFGPAVVGTR